MENNRSELSEFLHDLLAENGDPDNVYFQPPESMKIAYPCFIYRFSNIRTNYADNRPYRLTVSFDVTYITKDPVNEMPMRLAKTPMFSFDRHYIADNLHHYVYNTTSTVKEVVNG